MKRKTTASAIIALIVLVAILAGCSPSAPQGGSATPASSLMRAMAQAVETSALSSPDQVVTVTGGNNYSVTGFSADDGSTISGRFTTDPATGEIVSAELTYFPPNSTEGLEFVLKTESGTPEATIDKTPVTEELPRMMTRNERYAFAAALDAIEEVLEELQDEIEDVFGDDDYWQMSGFGEGWYPIPDGFGIQGRFYLAYEDDDRELELMGVDLTNLNIQGRRMSITGSYRYEEHERFDREETAMNLRIQNFRDDHVVLNDITVNATMTEDERRDNDHFRLEAHSIGGSCTVGGESFSFSFSGEIDAMEDHYFRFPSYSLSIDGDNVAIGRHEKGV